MEMSEPAATIHSTLFNNVKVSNKKVNYSLTCQYHWRDAYQTLWRQE